MRRYSTFLVAAAMSMAAFTYANDGIHYYNNQHCEVYGDIEEPDERAWYRRQEYLEYGPNEDPTEELDDDTSWPGQREDFSDTLFR